MNQTVYFDMDGTIADLYNVDNVFQRLDNNDPTVYLEAQPIPKYINMLREFKDEGHRIGIITSGSKFPPGTPPNIQDIVNKATEAAKRQWLAEQGLLPFIDTFQFIPHGVSKYDVAEDKTGILVDDDDSVLATWFSDKIKVK